jgi:putative peptide zinc metalloprotease protein
MERVLTELTLASGRDRCVPALRSDLGFQPQTFGRKTYYVVEDPLNARFYRIGVAEYTLMSLLDGRATLSEVLRATQAALPSCEFTLADVAAICQWVVRMGLAENGSVVAAGLPSRDVSRAGARRSGGRLSPLSMQVPLLHPDRLLGKVEPWFGWCFSLPASLAWCLVLGWAARDLATCGDRLSEASAGVLALDNWLWLAIAWFVLKVLHECGHAVACKRLGGEVREAGVIFILLAPLAYVDVTSTWRLRSKWARIQVAAAGMYVELFVAAVATLVWARTPLGVLSNVCLSIMTTAGVMTLLFNANPLMRFDGYYIVSDLLELPNLYLHGQQYVAGLTRRLVCGIPSRCSAGMGWRGVFVRCYGVASTLWRYSVFAGLVLTAATLLEGAGIVLSALALMLWLGSGLRRFVRLARDPAMTPSRKVRSALVLSGGVALVAVAVVLIPWPGTVVAPAIVQYAPEVTVRTESDGFVQEICVDNSQQVAAGDVLVVLSNPALEYQLAELQLSISESQVKRRVHQRQRELAKAQAEDEKLRTLESQLADKQQQVAHLVVRAPRSGKVVARNIQTLRGRYLHRGSDLLMIGDEASKEIRLSIAQQDVDTFRARGDAPLRAYLPGCPVFEASLARIEPRASTQPLDAALCAPHGGPLPVRRSGQGTHPADRTYELLAPRFTANMTLDPVASAQVHAGQLAVVAVHPYESVGRHVYHALLEWAQRRLHRA